MKLVPGVNKLDTSLFIDNPKFQEHTRSYFMPSCDRNFTLEALYFLVVARKERESYKTVYHALTQAGTPRNFI